MLVEKLLYFGTNYKCYKLLYFGTEEVAYIKSFVRVKQHIQINDKYKLLIYFDPSHHF